MSTVKAVNLQHPSSANANIVMDNSGRVGVGTSSPSYALDVNGYVRVASNQRVLFGTTSGGWLDDNFGNGDLLNITEKPYGLRFLKSDLSVEHMRINSDGHVTKPYQPVFCGYGRAGGTDLNTGSESTWTIWISQTAFINRGNYWNSSTGRFTCPVAGVYQVTGFFLCRNNAAHNVNVYKNGTSTGLYGRDITPSGEQNTGLIAFVDCAAGDILDIRVSNGSGGDFYHDYNVMTFSLFG